MKVSRYICDYCGKDIDEPLYPQNKLHFCGSECKEEYLFREEETEKELEELLKDKKHYPVPPGIWQ